MKQIFKSNFEVLDGVVPSVSLVGETPFIREQNPTPQSTASITYYYQGGRTVEVNVPVNFFDDGNFGRPYNTFKAPVDFNPYTGSVGIVVDYADALEWSEPIILLSNYGGDPSMYYDDVEGPRYNWYASRYNGSKKAPYTLSNQKPLLNVYYLREDFGGVIWRMSPSFAIDFSDCELRNSRFLELSADGVTSQYEVLITDNINHPTFRVPTTFNMDSPDAKIVAVNRFAIGNEEDGNYRYMWMTNDLVLDYNYNDASVVGDDNVLYPNPYNTENDRKEQFLYASAVPLSEVSSIEIPIAIIRYK